MELKHIVIFGIVSILIISVLWVFTEEQNEESSLASKYKIEYVNAISGMNLWEKAQNSLTKSIESQITHVGCKIADANINNSGMITQTVSLKNFIVLLSDNDTVYTRYRGFTFRVVTSDEYCWDHSSNQLAFAVFRGFQGFERWDDVTYEKVTEFSVVHGRTIYNLRIDDYYVYPDPKFNLNSDIFTNNGL
jgi:hypothetical protein